MSKIVSGNGGLRRSLPDTRDRESEQLMARTKGGIEQPRQPPSGGWSASRQPKASDAPSERADAFHAIVQDGAAGHRPEHPRTTCTIGARPPLGEAGGERIDAQCGTKSSRRGPGGTLQLKLCVSHMYASLDALTKGMR